MMRASEWARAYNIQGVEVRSRYHPDRATVVVSAKVKPFAMGEVVLEHEFSQMLLVAMNQAQVWPVESLVFRHNAIDMNLRTRPPLGVGLIAEVCGGAR